jgi:hypothetical protein
VVYNIFYLPSIFNFYISFNDVEHNMTESTI